MRGVGVLVLVLIAAGCNGSETHRSGPDQRMAQLEQTLAGQRDAETLANEVDSWVVRMSTRTPGPDRDRLEGMTSDLAARLEKIRPVLGRGAFDQGGNASLARELSDLKEAFGRAVATVPSERRAAEEKLTADVKDIGAEMTAFRVAVASASAQGNAEIKRRVAQLELGRREINDTLSELHRSDVLGWSALQRRWDRQRHAWYDDLRAARERLTKINPVPAGETKLQ